MTVHMRGVRHAYAKGAQRHTVLNDLDLDVEPGEVVVITGVSGAGKTTLLTLCGALRSLQDGELQVLGHSLRNADSAQQRELRASIGFVFQSHNLLDALAAGQNVLMSLLGGVSQAEGMARAGASLDALGLAAKIDSLPEFLSGGEKQRVAVARALVRNPRLILADEPTASLDDLSASAVKAALARTAKATGCAVMVATHDRRLFDIADRLLRLEEGRIVEMPAARPPLGAARSEPALVAEA